MVSLERGLPLTRRRHATGASNQVHSFYSFDSKGTAQYYNPFPSRLSSDLKVSSLLSGAIFFDSMAIFWVYIVQNPKGGFYIGSTDNLELRLHSHNREDR